MSYGFITYLLFNAESANVPAELSIYPSVQYKYKISSEGTLQRAKNSYIPKNCILGIKDDGGVKDCDEKELASTILSEVIRKNSLGTVLDIKATSANIPKAEYICRTLENSYFKTFLPYSLAGISDNSIIIIPASVSGGSLKEILNSLSNRFSAERLCVQINKKYTDFVMPSYNSYGKEIKYDEKEQLIKKYDAETFFSEKMCCKYFTYRENGKSHFVLFDDIYTAVYKLKLSISLGLKYAFLDYGEWGGDIKTIIEEIN